MKHDWQGVFYAFFMGICGQSISACSPGAGDTSASTEPTSSSTAQSCSNQADVCASPTGAGTSCTVAAPCSIVSAQAFVRNLRQDMNRDLVVELLGGLYRLSAPLQFTAADSGTNGHTVHYAAAAGASPIISGGIAITGWTLHDAAKNIFQARVPAGLETRQLYVNGVRAERARLTLQAVSPGNAVLGGGATATVDGYDLNVSGMSDWTNATDIEAVAASWWLEARCPLASVSAGHIAVQQPCWTLANYQQPRPMASGLNWLENAYAFLAEPGQWYMDRSANQIYYIPRAGEDLATADVELGGLETLVSGMGSLDAAGTPQFVQNISFEGLSFEYATWLDPNSSTGFAEIQAGVSRDEMSAGMHRTPGAVTFSRANNISFLRNTFQHLGEAGLNFDTGSQKAVITGNVFEDLSGGGITLGDFDDALQTSPTLQNSGHVISNNYFSNTGAEYAGSAAILVFYASHTSIDHNEIADAPYSGISLGWGWGNPSYSSNNTVEGNYIHDVMQTLYDGGAIYTNSASPGTILANNYVESVGTKGACLAANAWYVGYSGIYHDGSAAASLFIDTNNVVREMSCSGYWIFIQQGDTQITVRNAFVDFDRVYGCPPLTFGSSNCLNSNDNTVTGVVVFGGQPTPAAQALIDAAGLTAQYAGIKKATTAAPRVR